MCLEWLWQFKINVHMRRIHQWMEVGCGVVHRLLLKLKYLYFINFLESISGFLINEHSDCHPKCKTKEQNIWKTIGLLVILNDNKTANVTSQRCSVWIKFKHQSRKGAESWLNFKARINKTCGLSEFSFEGSSSRVQCLNRKSSRPAKCVKEIFIRCKLSQIRIKNY